MNEKTLHSLETMPFFTKAALLTLERISDNALSQNLKRWVKNGRLLRLKNGLFVSKTFRDRTLNSPGYIELIANTLTSPSYVSLEYVLQRYSLLTEATYAVTSVTTKSSRRFGNAIGTFVYHTVSKNLYFGFEKKTFGKNIYFEASPAKALFDFLYLRLPNLDVKDFRAIEELRINWDLLSPEHFRELGDVVIRGGIQKMAAVFALVKKEFYGHADR